MHNIELLAKSLAYIEKNLNRDFRTGTFEQKTLPTPVIVQNQLWKSCFGV